MGIFYGESLFGCFVKIPLIMRSPMSNLPITITVKLFAACQEAEGLSELKLEFPKETPVSQALERLSTDRPLF